MPGYRFSKLARLDLMDIADYTVDRWSVAQAIRYLDDLDDCIRRLIQNPRLGRPCDAIRQGYRRIEHGKHVVIYRADAQGIFVCRVLHQTMLPRHGYSRTAESPRIQP